MKHLLFVCLCFTTVLSSAQEPNAMTKMKWLVGTWARINTKPDRASYEQWQLAPDGSLKGKAANVKGADTVYVEKLKILAENGNLYYVADVPENKVPVYFEITSVTDRDFVCENPKHDFPKKIEYHLQADGRLLAQISGDGKKIDYWFERRK